jgi:hypothetical protein
LFGDTRIWTQGLSFTRHVLYYLSYTPRSQVIFDKGAKAIQFVFINKSTDKH